MSWLKSPTHKTIVLLCLIASFLGVMIPSAYSFVRSRSISGIPIFWTNPNLSVRVNPINSSGLNESQIDSAFRSSFDQWTQESSSISYAYTQSNNIPPVSADDGNNTIYFSTAANRRMGSGVVAMTEVTYFVRTGVILGMDMVFNDRDFDFTMVEGDTGETNGARTKIFLPDVATHEIGHAYGFDHSNLHRSSLIYVAFNGQFKASEDDKRGVHATYGTNNPGRQSIVSGSVQGKNGGIMGAQVSAINLHTGVVEGGTLSQPDGSFVMSNLPAGEYSFMVEPFLTSPLTISPFFANVNHRFCSGAHFRRTFYSACEADGQAASVSIDGNQINLGTIAPSCDFMPNGTPDLSDGDTVDIEQEGGAFFNSLSTNQTHYYRLQNVAGEISARALSYTLFAPIDVEVDILFPDGTPIPTSSSEDNVAEPMPGGLTNFDSQAEAWNLVAGDYLVRVRSKADFLWSFLFPAGLRLMDSAGYYFLSIAVNGNIPVTNAQSMDSCAEVPNRPQTAFTFGNTQSRGDSSDDELSGGCGTVLTNGGSGPTNPFQSSIFFVLLIAFLSKFFHRITHKVAALSRRR